MPHALRICIHYRERPLELCLGYKDFSVYDQGREGRAGDTALLPASLRLTERLYSVINRFNNVLGDTVGLKYSLNADQLLTERMGHQKHWRGG